MAVIKDRYSDTVCEAVDLLRSSGLPGFRKAPELYQYFSAGHIWLYNLLFGWFDSRWMMDTFSRLMYGPAHRRIDSTLQAFRPDVVVVIHPLLVRPICTYRQMTGATWPVVTVVTDLVSIHASWFTPNADQYLVPTQEAFHLAAAHGVEEAKILKTGFPVHPRFLRPLPGKYELRHRLGLKPEQFTILLTSGGAGGNIRQLAEAIESRCPDLQLLVVTGRNKAIKQAFDRRPVPALNTHVFGFVDNMEELMTAADIIVGKAGPGTIMEAATLSRKLILTGAVGRQEEGNLLFSERLGLGVHLADTESICNYLRQSSSHPDEVTVNMGSSKLLAGTEQIADIILNLKGSKINAEN